MELTALLHKLKMEHLEAQLDAVCEQAAQRDLDYKTFFDALFGCGFDGWVSYEMCWPLRDGGDLATLEAAARKFIQYMQAWKAPGTRHEA